MRDLVVFVLIAFGGAYLLDWLWLLRAGEGLGFVIGGIVRMWMPALAVGIVGWLGYGRVSRRVVGWCVGRITGFVAGVLAPVIVVLGSWALGWLAGFPVRSPGELVEYWWRLALEQGGISDEEMTELATVLDWTRRHPALVLTLVIGMALVSGATVNGLVALGEELAWRGYLFGRLLPRLGYYGQVMVVGGLWGLWHGPLIVVLGYNYPGHSGWLPFVVFVVYCVAVSYGLSGLRALSGSVLPAAIAHGTINGLGGLALALYDGDSLIWGPAGWVMIIGWLVVGLVLDGLRWKGARRRIVWCSGQEEEPVLT